MPAEWEPHQATWLGWPHNRSDWPGKITTVQWVYGEIVRKLAPGEIARMLVNSAAHERQARRAQARVGIELGGRRVAASRVLTKRGPAPPTGPAPLRTCRSPAALTVE